MTAVVDRSGRRRRRRLGSAPILTSATILAIGLVVAAAGRLIAPHDPDAQDLLLGVTSRSPGHLLGTDDLGRDVLSRLLVGARTAVIGPAAIAAGSLVLGSAIGLLAGFKGGALGALLMRFTDLIYAVPGLLVAIVVAGVSGGGYWTAVCLLIVLFCPYDARLVRAATLAQRHLPYVEAARLLGTPTWRVLLAELWPNVRSLELANAFLNFAYALVSLSALSFLGIGVPVGSADWGSMLAAARSYLDLNPWAALAPGLAIALMAAATAVLGDALAERLHDAGRVR